MDVTPTYSALILVAAFLLTLAVFVIKSYETQKVDPREPPVVSAAIPYAGHLIGMILYGSSYIKSLGSRYEHRIFTLPMLGSRTYIVTDPNLAAAVQRASKVLSFNPVIPEVTQRVLGFDETTIQLMKTNMESGFVQEIQGLVHSRLSPGSSLDALTLAAGREFIHCVDRYRFQVQGLTVDKSEDLLTWVKGIVTQATACLLFGHENPIEGKLSDSFWDFDSGIPLLLVGVAPSILAKKAHKGREALVDALNKFNASENHHQAAELTKDRGLIAAKHGVGKLDIARSDLSFLFAGIVNTSLTSFWLMLNIYADRNLLEEIRHEVESTIRRPRQSNKLGEISISRIAKDCPLLVSSLRETLRVYSDNFSTRVVTQDFLLAETYFLRKGSVLQISGGIMHTQENIWGGNAHAFEPRRFCLQNNVAEKPKHAHPAAFRAFGGGSTLCPGRHFAINEIAGFVAITVLMLDISGINSSELQIPTKDDRVLPVHVLEPTNKVPVEIKLRLGWEEEQLRVVD